MSLRSKLLGGAAPVRPPVITKITREIPAEAWGAIEEGDVLECELGSEGGEYDQHGNGTGTFTLKVNGEVRRRGTFSEIFREVFHYDQP